MRDCAPLRLADVANVVEDHQQLIGDAVINGGPGLMLIVEKLPWGNTLEVTRGVEEALKELQPGLTGIAVDTTMFRPASFIEESLGNLSLALLLGCFLVVLVLSVFLFQWRTALVSVTAIPLSLMAAALVLYWTGGTINTMVLAGLVIAVGVVVDDAIIDVENIVRRLRHHRASGGTESTARVVVNASLEVRGPIVYATLIIVAATVPIFFLDGLTGAFFRPAGHLLHPGRDGVHAGGPHGHAGHGVHLPAQCQAGRPGSAGGPGSQALVRRRPCGPL